MKAACSRSTNPMFMAFRHKVGVSRTCGDVMVDATVGRRRAPRHYLRAPGAYRTGSGTLRAVHLTDLSKVGCRFADPSARLYVGTQLTVKIGNLGAVDATVVWIDGVKVGIRFNQELYEPLFDHLLQEFHHQHAGLERRTFDRGSAQA